ncbi:MAG: hypothetical protein NZM43_13620 [Saprospiraceae bacterium]|nr:hypothetical protein [Saprospiraceae bacterium]MDW8485353.1 hypothetical protein [Saprospiraceae bacterium]
MNKITFFVVVALISSMLIACKKEKCPSGYVKSGDNCICPAGKYEGKGMCRDLKPNEYYGIMNGCPCNDTLFFEVIGKDEKLLRYRIDLGWGYTGGALGIIPLSDGDSLHVEIGSSLEPCVVFDSTYYGGAKRFAYATFSGKFIENNTKIRMTVRYYPMGGDGDPTKELARCSFILSR